MNTGRPDNLTFFCELHQNELVELFSDPDLIGQLQALHASISLGILDLSDERAKVVKRLNASHIPVIAWQLLPIEQGYWYNINNAHLAVAS